jgi:nicotinate phosphoribosyltransferase
MLNIIPLFIRHPIRSDAFRELFFHLHAREKVMRAHDLVDRFRMANAEFTPPVRSLTDTDFYKLLMLQVIWEKYRNVHVAFELIVRDRAAPVGDMIDGALLQKCLEHVQGLRFQKSDLLNIRGQDLHGLNMFKEPFIQYLKNDFKLSPFKVRQRDGVLSLRFEGAWPEVTMWEIPGLATVSDLYYRSILRNVSKDDLEKMYRRAMDRMERKVERLITQPGLRIAEFGTRRRHNFLWQEWVVKMFKKDLGPIFTGTSNLWLAIKYHLDAIGTNAHELPMVLVALADGKEAKIDAQYQVLRDWEASYAKSLRIMLPDTYGTAQFFRNAPSWVSEWTGLRQDSGKPEVIGQSYIDWNGSRNVDSMQRLTLFTDGQDVDPMLNLYDSFHNRTKVGFGWGTMATNDFEGTLPIPLLRPFSMVCKVVEANGRPCVKLSDNPNKATGPKDEVARYVSEYFGGEGRTSVEVKV